MNPNSNSPASTSNTVKAILIGSLVLVFENFAVIWITGWLYPTIIDKFPAMSGVFRSPRPVSCIFEPANDPQKGEPYLYNVHLYVNYKFRDQLNQIAIFKENDDSFIVKDTLTTERISLNNTYWDDSHQKRIFGFDLNYSDPSKWDDGKVHFQMQFTKRKKGEKCDNLIIHER